MTPLPQGCNRGMKKVGGNSLPDRIQEGFMEEVISRKLTIKTTNMERQIDPVGKGQSPAPWLSPAPLTPRLGTELRLSHLDLLQGHPSILPWSPSSTWCVVHQGLPAAAATLTYPRGWGPNFSAVSSTTGLTVLFVGLKTCMYTRTPVCPREEWEST